MSETLIRVIIRGCVQGVWYRGWTADRAEALGLSGWVRNRRDGSVEALFAGEQALVRQMIEDCRAGPPAARVEAIEEFPGSGPAPAGFEQRGTL